MKSKVFQIVGLATKAGKTVSGEFSVEKSIQKGEAKLVIVSEEASDNTKKLFKNKCDFYKVSEFEYGTKEEIGKATGKKTRASLAVLDEGFASSIKKLLEK